MSKPSVIVRASQKGGFHWRVIIDSETISAGDAATEREASNAANEAVKRLGSDSPPGP